MARQVLGLIALFAMSAVCIPATRHSAAGEPTTHRSIFDDDAPASPPLQPKPVPPSGSQPSTINPPVISPPVISPPVVRPVVPPPSVNGQEVAQGLVAELRDGADFGLIRESRIVSRVRVVLEPGTDELPISLQWRGLINIPAGGMTVNFLMIAAGSTTVVEVDGHKVGTANSGIRVTLGEGAHPIDISISHIKGTPQNHTLWLSWLPKGEEVQTVPSFLFSHYKKDEPALSAAPATGFDPLSGRPPVSPGVGVAPVSPSPSPAPAPVSVVHKGELPVPSDAQLSEMHKSIKAKYANYYTQPGLIVRQTLIKKLIDAADASAVPAEKYAMLKEAADLSVGAGDLKTALACDETLAGTFKVEETDLKLATLTAASHGAKNATFTHEVGTAAMDMSDRAMAADDFDLALKAATVAEAAFNSAKDDDAARAKARVRDVREIQQQYAKIAPLVKKLKENSDDADTNLKVGRYFCLTVGAWEKGLPLLARGSDIALKGLADVEASNPADTDTQLKLGDAWWDKATGEVISAAAKCKDRACFWYDKARAASSQEVPDRVLGRLATRSRTIDLLPNVTINDNTNSWKRDHNGLSYTGNFYVPLQLDYRPVGDYDFAVEFIVNGGNGGITQMLPVKGQVLDWRASGFFSNFTGFIRRAGSLGPVQKGTVQIVPGKRYVSVVQFRQNGVRGVINGTVVREWQTDYTDLSSNMIKPADPRCLGLAASGGEVTITAIKVQEIPRGSK